MTRKHKNTLVFVDRALSIAIAAKLVGVLQTESEQAVTKAGFNWLLTTGIEAEEGSAVQTDLRELLPEELVYRIYPQIREKHSGLEGLRRKLSTGHDQSLMPGDVISVCGKIRFPGLGGKKLQASPFSGVELQMPIFSFHGEACIVAELHSDSFTIPVYFPKNYMYQIVFTHEQPVEITGVLRWVPPYSPGGAGSLNLAVRCAAAWLR